ncbi:molybdenum cofactor guanylyltransferase [Chloroflexota bacterium]
MKVTSIILAGGKNRRLGRNKALEVFEGTTLIERVVKRLSPLSGQTLVITAMKREDLPPLDGVELVPDIKAGLGPLGGIYSGLVASSLPYSIVVACDMPFLNTELLRHMIELIGDYDAVVPRLENGMVEPLHAVYARKSLEVLKSQLDDNSLKVHVLLEKLNVRYLEREESSRIDPRLLSFFNINRQSDLDQAVSLAENENLSDCPH